MNQNFSHHHLRLTENLRRQYIVEYFRGNRLLNEWPIFAWSTAAQKKARLHHPPSRYQE